MKDRSLQEIKDGVVTGCSLPLALHWSGGDFISSDVVVGVLGLVAGVVQLQKEYKTTLKCFCGAKRDVVVEWKIQ